MHARGHRRWAVLLGAGALVGALGGCGSDDDTATAAAASGSSATIEATEVWARESPMMTDAGAVYLTLNNPGTQSDRLVEAAVDGDVAENVELHETSAEGGTGETGTTDGGMGMVEMRPVEAIDIPPEGTVSLEPGGYHIMLLGLAGPLSAGDSFEVTLSFERAPDLAVTAEVRAS